MPPKPSAWLPKPKGQPQASLPFKAPEPLDTKAWVAKKLGDFEAGGLNLNKFRADLANYKKLKIHPDRVGRMEEFLKAVEEKHGRMEGYYSPPDQPGALANPRAAVTWDSGQPKHDEKELNGVPFTPVPPNWEHTPDAIAEPPLPVKSVWQTLPDGTKRLTPMRQASGVIMVEPDGRIWLVEPTNHYADYDNTYPKGGVEKGLTPQQNALKEVQEEAGLQAQITGYLGDYQKTGSMTRYYIGKRVGGQPWTAHWETARVKLVPLSHAAKLLNNHVDRQVLEDLQTKLTEQEKRSAEAWMAPMLDVPRIEQRATDWSEEDHPRAPNGQFARAAGGSGHDDADKQLDRLINNAVAHEAVEKDNLHHLGFHSGAPKYEQQFATHQLREAADDHPDKAHAEAALTAAAMIHPENSAISNALAFLQDPYAGNMVKLKETLQNYIDHPLSKNAKAAVFDAAAVFPDPLMAAKAVAAALPNANPKSAVAKTLVSIEKQLKALPAAAHQAVADAAAKVDRITQNNWHAAVQGDAALKAKFKAQKAAALDKLEAAIQAHPDINVAHQIVQKLGLTYLLEQHKHDKAAAAAAVEPTEPTAKLVHHVETYVKHQQAATTTGKYSSDLANHAYLAAAKAAAAHPDPSKALDTIQQLAKAHPQEKVAISGLENDIGPVDTGPTSERFSSMKPATNEALHAAVKQFKDAKAALDKNADPGTAEAMTKAQAHLKHVIEHHPSMQDVADVFYKHGLTTYSDESLIDSTGTKLAIQAPPAPAAPTPSVVAKVESHAAGLTPPPASGKTFTYDPSIPASGTQGGKWYKDEAGHLWFGKTLDGDADRVGVEYVANHVYRALGIDAPASKMTMVDGEHAVMSPKVDGKPAKSFDKLLASDVKDGFIVDAFLANRDVFGAGTEHPLENVFVKDGKATRIDNGASMFFTGMGAPKPFDAEVKELQTFRDPKYHAGKVYHSISDAEAAKQIKTFGERWHGGARDAIHAVIDSSPMSAEMKQKAKSTLDARAHWLTTKGLEQVS